MRRTILSENQYDPRFITAAKINAIMIPFEPPSSSPIRAAAPLSSAEQQRRFQSVGHGLYFTVSAQSVQTASSPARNAARHGRSSTIDVLVQRMRAVAARAEAV